MVRVKIKTPHSSDPRKRRKFLELLSSNDIYVTRLITSGDGFIALTPEEDLDKLFNNVIDKKREEHGYTPIIPPQLKVLRSVLLFRVDNYIFENNEQDIKEEIEARNEWIGEIAKVHKFPRGSIL